MAKRWMKAAAILACAALATSTVLGMVGCNNDTAPTTQVPTQTPTTQVPTQTPTTQAPTQAPTTQAPVKKDSLKLSEMKYPFAASADAEAYDKESAKVYAEVLGEYYNIYQIAKNDARSIAERYAIMAVAEAKLMESAVMMPTQTQGGNYAISRVAPNTVPFALWGNDQYRYHDALVVDGTPIKAADRKEMKAKYNELKGSGEYYAWAKKFLSDKGYKLKKSYTLGYSSDPQTWDALATSRAADSEAIVNTYDGLYEYNCEGTLTPALAESYTVSEDGLTYTFKIRKGAVWTDSQGRKVADVKADDFVAGFQHMLDTMAGLEFLVDGVVKGASEYINGETTDMSKVGVKATDDTTLVYTLENECSYFMTMLGYGVFAPLSRSYYQSQGGSFGADYAEKGAGNFGVDPEHIAYSGPYLVSTNTANSTIEFTANPLYWNKANIQLEKITWLYNDGTDQLKAYNDMKAGVLDGCGLNNSALKNAKEEGWFEPYSYVSATNATSFMAFYNLNRAAYENFNDQSVKSPKTDAQKDLTNKAMMNVHFRRAISMSFDRAAYNAVTVGEELKLNSLRNSYTPGNFVSLDEDVVVDINGKDVTFKAGTEYGEIMQAQIDADGVKITVFDKNATTDNRGDGFDGWYNVAAAKEELQKAVDELKAQGVNVTKENPVYIDLPTYAANNTYNMRCQAYKQSVESAMDGLVKVNLIEATQKEWYYCGYYTDFGYEANYDMYDLSGWGPDYGDPASYLDTFLPDYAGYMIKCIGIY